ncbi:MAG: ankyrin repeat domain-containing protein [bacterium]
MNAKSRWWAGGFRLLHSASPELAAYAIKRGAIVDVHAAARLGMYERLQELISRDPGLVRARGGDGQTPLHFASTVEIAAFLLDHGAEIDALDVDHESTPAQYMVADRQELVRYLISRGCKTDILMAAAVGDVDLVRNKLDADPDCIRTCVSDEYFPMINKKSGGTIYQWTLGFYMSAHQVARKSGHDHVLQLLFERSPAAVKLIAACWLNDEATVHSLRAEHTNLAKEFTDADRRQVAHAARNNETEVVRRLLENGLPVDAKGQHMATPLHWAAFHGNLEMAKIVLRFGPPLEALDADFGATPLGWAMHGSEHGWYCQTGDYAGTVEALLAAGAKPPVAIAGSPGVQEVLRRLETSERPA